MHQKQPQDAPAMQAKLSLKKSISDKLKILFQTVHVINIKARPLRDYEYITVLD